MAEQSIFTSVYTGEDGLGKITAWQKGQQR